MDNVSGITEGKLYESKVIIKNTNSPLYLNWKNY